MFATLRSRLALTYLLLIGVLLGMTVLILLLVVRNIPIRSTTIRLQEIARLLPEAARAADLSPQGQADFLNQLARQYDVRILIAGPLGAVVFDSGAGEQPPIDRLPPPRPGDEEAGAASTLRAADGKLWQLLVLPVNERFRLALAAPRPPVQWLGLFADELLPPLLVSAGIAVLLAALIAGLTARWVSRPLGRIAEAARGVPLGAYTPIEESGPQEVQQLAHAFNEMSAQVQAGRQAQRDFVANVSHELKTPLTAIQGFAQAIEEGAAASPEEVRRAAAVIRAEAGRMHRLALDLLDLARIEGGAAEFTRAPVVLQDLLAALIEKFAPQAQAAQVQIESRLEPLPAVTGDGDRLMQVFANLLDNAVKHSPPGGLVDVTLERMGEAASVSFRDCGPGIPPEKQERIFERFYQLDESRARRGGQAGFGLGLAIAREIVLAHAGELLVESEPGRGSTFVVKLPFLRS